jgi:Ca2+-binding RTX toxin-like protein
MKEALLPRRLILALAGAVCALCLWAPGALAATLSNSGGVMTVNGNSGSVQSWSFSDTPPDTVNGTFTQDKVIYPAGNPPAPNCTDTDPGPPPNQIDGVATNVQCTGVTKLVTTSGDSGSTINGGALNITPVDMTGGSGNDALTGGNQNDAIRGMGGNDNLKGLGGNDVVDGGLGNDTLYGDQTCNSCTPSGDDTLIGGPGSDSASGGPGNDNIDTGTGNDMNVDGGPGNDIINTGDGDDKNVTGGAGDDVINTGAGDDDVYGNDGNDTINAGDGNDYIESGNGNDTVDAGAGDDYIYEESDGYPDVVHGGPGMDTLEYDTNSNSSVNDQFTSTFDDQTNDGFRNLSGSVSNDDANNNFASDLESLLVFVGDTPSNVTGNAAANDMETTGNGADVFDPGPGSDVLYTRGGPDTVSTVDGYPDYVDCGAGVDTATVDQFDTTVLCENVIVRQVPSAFEDAPPAVAWVSPKPGAILPSDKKAHFEATAIDDKGVAKVVFLIGSREVCSDTTAPYSCDYLPTSADLGKNTLIAQAVDTAGQTGTALITATIPRFTAIGLRASTTPKADLTVPWTFVTTGKLILPANVSAADGCKLGYIAVQFRNGRNTISNRRVALKPDCTFRSSVTFSNASRLRARAKTLDVFTRFTGNLVLGPRNARVGTVRVKP